MRIAQLVVVAIPEAELREVDELPPSERGTGGFGSSGTRSGRGQGRRLGGGPQRAQAAGSAGTGAGPSVSEPRIRVSALLAWREGILLCRHEKPGRSTGCCPAGA